MEYQSINLKIRNGDISDAQRMLRALTIKNIARADYHTFANLARRAGLPHISIRLMNPILRSDKSSDAPLNSPETMEYAMALIKIGAVNEGRILLSGIQEHPPAKLFLALSYFHEWEYVQPIPMIESYLRQPELDEYQRLVARANLCAAYVITEQFEKAEPMLAECIALSSKNGYRLLNGNFLELTAQMYIQQRKFVQARAALDQAAAILIGSPMSDFLFVRKWKSILDLLESASENINANSSILACVGEARQSAIDLGHWETMRDLDFYQLVASGENGLFNHLFHGTPYSAYRSRLKLKFPHLGEPAFEYLWRLQKNDNAPILDLQDGSLVETFDVAVNVTETELPLGSLMHQLLGLLAADFYRPVPLASLAARLFSDEFYNPRTTPNRVHQLMTRLRNWAAQYGIPLRINEHEGYYSLGCSRPLILRTQLINSVPIPKFRHQLQIESFRKTAGEDLFSTKEFAANQGCSLRTALRVLNAATDAGVVNREGSGSATRFRFVASGLASARRAA